jgi:hypothetical protein
MARGRLPSVAVDAKMNINVVATLNMDGSAERLS